MTKNTTPTLPATLQRPGYKHTKLGWIPVEWDVVRLEKIIKIGTGQVDPKESAHLDKPLVAPNHINSGSGIIHTYQSTRSQNAVSGKYLVKKGEIIYSKIRPYLQKAAITEIECLCSADMYPISGVKIDNKYLLYVLLSNHFTQYANTVSARTGIPKINRPDLIAYHLPLPPLPEQHRIATLFTTWDRAITTTQALIDQLETRKRGLMQRLLTGEVRLPGFSGEWKEYRAGKIFESISDKKHDGNFEVLSATQENGVIPRSEVGIDIKYDKASLANYKKIRAGDFVISLRSFQGGIEHSNYEGLVSPAYTVLRETKPIGKFFFRELFKSQNFINRLNSIIYGIRDGKQISYKEFSSLKFIVPPLKEQLAVGNLADKLNKEADLNRRNLVQLQRQKRGLMQQLLTGQKRLLA